MVQASFGSVNLKSELRLTDEASGGGSPLPCLYGNNSIEGLSEEQKEALLDSQTHHLTPSHKRTAHTLYRNVEKLINHAPTIGHIGFLTLTFADKVTDYHEASRRLNSLKTNYLNKCGHFGLNDITVPEFHLNGSIHFHMIVEVKYDIRTGYDHEEVARRNYKSASPWLRDEVWKGLRESLPLYGFGRHSLEPIKSNAEAMGRYVGKYISKSIGSRTEEQRGMRLVNYSRRGDIVWDSSCFAWVTEGAKRWRRDLAYFAQALGCSEFYQISEKLGAGWAHKYFGEIMNAYENYGLNVAKGKPREYKNGTVHALETNNNRRANKRAAIEGKGYFAGMKDRERLARQERQEEYCRRMKQEGKALVGSIIARRKAQVEEAKRESEKLLKEFLKDPLWVRAKQATPNPVPF